MRPGDRWDELESRVRPGDEIILMPGEHRAARFERLRGTAKRPITIRGLDPARPSLIEADQFGIRIREPQHIRISNLIIAGATINGIRLEGGKDLEPGAIRHGDCRIHSVRITDTGPRGLRPAISLQNVDRIRIDDCTIDAWAGAGVDVVQSSDVQIEGCLFSGHIEYDQISGVHVRAGSDRVRVEACRFLNTGDYGVVMGGASRDRDLAGLPEQPKSPLFEASRVRVINCTFENGLCAVAFVNAQRCSVRSCTIVRPRHAVLSIRNDQPDPRFGPVSNCAFSSNLISWQPGDLKQLGHLGEGIDPEAVMYLDENLWWSPDFAETRERLGPFPGRLQQPQIVDLDPGLGEGPRPTVAIAQQFGAAVIQGDD